MASMTTSARKRLIARRYGLAKPAMRRIVPGSSLWSVTLRSRESERAPGGMWWVPSVGSQVLRSSHDEVNSLHGRMYSRTRHGDERRRRSRSPTSSAPSSGASGTAANRDLGPLGITWSQLRALRTVDRCDGPIRMSELAARLGIARRSATSVVDDLVGHGLLERRADPADRRAVEVAVTRGGRPAPARLRDRRRSAPSRSPPPCRRRSWRRCADLLRRLDGARDRAGPSTPPGTRCRAIVTARRAGRRRDRSGRRST